jgi:hypothetical protein
VQRILDTVEDADIPIPPAPPQIEFLNDDTIQLAFTGTITAMMDAGWSREQAYPIVMAAFLSIDSEIDNDLLDAMGLGGRADMQQKLVFILMFGVVGGILNHHLGGEIAHMYSTYVLPMRHCIGTTGVNEATILAGTTTLLTVWIRLEQIPVQDRVAHARANLVTDTRQYMDGGGRNVPAQ